MTFPGLTVWHALMLPPPILALIGVLVGTVAGLLTVYVIALCSGDAEELGKVIPGRRR